MLEATVDVVFDEHPTREAIKLIVIIEINKIDKILFNFAPLHSKYFPEMF